MCGYPPAPSLTCTTGSLWAPPCTAWTRCFIWPRAFSHWTGCSSLRRGVKRPAARRGLRHPGGRGAGRPGQDVCPADRHVCLPRRPTGVRGDTSGGRCGDLAFRACRRAAGRAVRQGRAARCGAATRPTRRPGHRQGPSEPGPGGHTAHRRCRPRAARGGRCPQRLVQRVPRRRNQEIIADPDTWQFHGYQFLGDGRDVRAPGSMGHGAWPYSARRSSPRRERARLSSPHPATYDGHLRRKHAILSAARCGWSWWLGISCRSIRRW